MKKSLIALCAILLTSCSFQTQKLGGVEGRVKVGAPIVYIHPLTDVSRNSKVGVLPFAVPAIMNEQYGLRVAAIFKDVFLQKRVFRMVRQLEAPYADIRHAVAMGRKAGMDIVLVGEILDVMSGTQFGGAKVDVAMRLVGTKSGQTLWYLQQSISQPMDYADTSMGARLIAPFWSPSKNEPGPPAIPNMLVGIAGNMAEVVIGGKYI